MCGELSDEKKSTGTSNKNFCSTDIFPDWSHVVQRPIKIDKMEILKRQQQTTSLF